MEKTEKIWMNGKFIDWDDSRVHILTHALHYATAVFESLRCYNTAKGPATFRMREHFERFMRSGKTYSMKIPYSPEDLSRAVKELIRLNKVKECYVRPLAYRGYGEMGLNPSKNPVDVSLALWPWGPYLGEEGQKKGVRCKISSWCRVDSRILPSGAKASANYANSVLAKIEALDCGYDEAIQLNLNGLVAEGPGENILMIKDGLLITPPEGAGALEGITLNSVLEISRELGIPFLRRDIPREELFNAGEIFFTGTAAEITPVREIDGRIIGNGGRGPLTEKIQKKFFDIVKGKEEKYYQWLDFV